MKKIVPFSITCAILLAPMVAEAATIAGTSIIPSTTLIPVAPFSLNQINDGITSDAPPFNGFASNIPSGTITLDLVGDYNLTSFILWNDINVLAEGISQFRLDFFDSSNNLIPVSFTNTFLAPIGQVAPATYNFSQAVPNVSRVDLVVLSSNIGVFNRIEIREVEFTGSPASIPEPNNVLGVILLGAGCLLLNRKNGRGSM